MKKFCANRRYFILCKFLDSGKTWLFGKGRSRIVDLNCGYKNFSTACNSCDLIYAKRFALGDNVACSVISLDI